MSMTAGSRWGERTFSGKVKNTIINWRLYCYLNTLPVECYFNDVEGCGGIVRQRQYSPRNSQKPKPRGIPVSRSNISLGQRKVSRNGMRSYIVDEPRRCATVLGW
jgi:hypothetical protein